MINVLRKNQKGLWIVIAVLCIPFVFYFSNSKIGAMGQNQLGEIYGRAVPIAEAQRGARLFNLARELGMYNFLQSMVAGAQTENDAYAEFTWNRLVLQHEAERLGIKPSSEEAAKVVQGLQPFAGANGVFDLNKYTEFTKSVLPSLGFTEDQLEELASASITLQRVKDLVGLGVHMPEAEAKAQYEQAYGKLNVSVARLRTDEIAKDLQVSDDEITKYHEAHQAELKSEERRKVSFVAFALDEEQKKLQSKERVDALQKLADHANDFNQAIGGKGSDFAQAAAKFQLPLQHTGEFTRTTPDPLLQATPQLAKSSFQLSPENPNSDAVQVGDGFYILHLDGVVEAKPLALEEAKPKIVDAIKKQRASEMLAAKAAEVKTKVAEAIKNGTPAENAVAQAGVPFEKVPAFSLTETPTPPPQTEPGKEAPPAPPAPPADLQVIKSAVAELEPGDVSEMVPTESGALIAVMQSREAPASGFEQLMKQMFESRFLRSRQEVVFYEWLRERRREAGAPMGVPIKVGAG